MAEAPQRAWAELRARPFRVQVFFCIVTAAALVLPIVLSDPEHGQRVTHHAVAAAVLIAISVLNVEIARALTGGLETSQQPHKALSAWAFASALLLPTAWLLLVVPVTYLHARWRGLRTTLFKWIGSGAFLVLAALAADGVGFALIGDERNWMFGSGAQGLVAVVAAMATFMAVETALFFCIAYLNDARDEVWLRATLRSPSFYLTESAVLLIGGLLAAVWTGGAWFVLLFVPIYALAQRAALHEPLREQADTLEAANQFKADLMGMLGHEVGNPLTTVVGYAQVGLEALEDGDPDFARQSFQVVERSAGSVQTVLAEILALVASDTSTLSAKPEVCLLEPVLQAVVAMQPPDQRPAVACPPGLAAYVQPSHLNQVLVNLLVNARKYAGGATLLSAQPRTDKTVVVAVTDAGPGVPAEFREHLFERFSRERTTATRVKGTGLGLFIARELARANGGELTVRAAEPQGSVFELTLPAAR